MKKATLGFLVGAAGLMLSRVAGAGSMAGLFVAMFITVGVRILAIAFDWRLPRVLVSVEEQFDLRDDRGE